MLTSFASRFLLYLALVTTLASAVNVARAQNAELTGSVLDAEGFAITGVKLIVINDDTQVHRTTMSTSAGIYDVPALPPGSYTIRAEKAGFEALQQTGVTLYTATVSRLDLHLSVGHQDETVQVIADASLLQADNAAVSTIVGNKDVVALPLNGRTYTQLATLAPGVAMSEAVGLPVYNTYESPSLAGEGGFMSVSGSRADSTEFTMDGIETDAGADGGGFAFPPIDSIQEFQLLQSNYSAEYGFHPGQVVLTMKGGTNQFHGSLYEFIRNDVLDASNFFATTGKNPLKQNQFGASLGGPVLLPGYSGKRRTFFFVNYEGGRIRSGSTETASVPTALMRQGDFSQLSKPILDPTTGTSFAGNLIPADRVSQLAANIITMTQYPLPNLSGLANNFSISPTASTNLDQVFARVDHSISGADQLHGTVFWTSLSGYAPRFTEISPTAEPQSVQAYSLHETHVFSSTLLNDARGGWNFSSDFRDWGNTEGITRAALGFPQNGNQPAGAGVGEFDISGYGSTGANSTELKPEVQHYELADTVTWSQTSHTLKLGVDFIHQKDFLSSNNGVNGTYSFSGQYSGNGFADFLLGLPSSAHRQLEQTYPAVYHILSDRYGIFAQDDWHLSRRVALNFGLRYENNIRPVEENNEIANWIVGEVNGEPGLVEITAPDPTYGRCLCIPRNLDFAPRVGVTYRFGSLEKTVVRAGYGILYSFDISQVATDMNANAPFTQSQTITNQIGEPIFDLANAFLPTIVAQGSGGLGAQINRHDGRVQQWTAGFQRDLGYSIVLDVNYLGSSSEYLEADQQLNTAMPGPGAFPDRRPYPNSPLSGTFLTDNASANYEAGTARVSRQFSKGLTFTTHFTWAKSLDDASVANNGAAQNPTYDLRSNWGLSGFNVARRFIASAVYELPIGGGNAMLRVSGPVGIIASGWSLAPIYTLQAGFPFTVTTPNNTANIETGSLFPDQSGSTIVANRSYRRWFDTGAFSQPALYQFGNERRNSLIGPGTNDLDLALMKDTRLSEEIRLQFRGEFFNAFNHPNFAAPNSSFGTASFGSISSSGAGREIQFAMKVLF